MQTLTSEMVDASQEIVGVYYDEFLSIALSTLQLCGKDAKNDTSKMLSMILMSMGIGALEVMRDGGDRLRTELERKAANIDPKLN